MAPSPNAVEAFSRLTPGQRKDLLSRLPANLLPEAPAKPEKPAISFLNKSHIELIRQKLDPFAVSLERQYKELYGPDRRVVINSHYKNGEARQESIRIRFFAGDKLEALMDCAVKLQKPRARKELAALGLDRDPVTPREMLTLTGKMMSDYSGIDALEAHYEIKRVSEAAKAVLDQFARRGFLKKDEAPVAAGTAPIRAVQTEAEDPYSISFDVPVLVKENEHPSNEHLFALRDVYNFTRPKNNGAPREHSKPINLDVPEHVDYEDEELAHIQATVDRFTDRLRRNSGHRHFIQSVDSVELHDGSNQLAVRLRIREAISKPAHEKHPSPNSAFNSRSMLVKGYIQHHGNKDKLGTVMLTEVTASNPQRQIVKINDFNLRKISGFLTALNEGGATTSQSLKKRNFNMNDRDSVSRKEMLARLERKDQRDERREDRREVFSIHFEGFTI